MNNSVPATCVVLFLEFVFYEMTHFLEQVIRGRTNFFIKQYFSFIGA